MAVKYTCPKCERKFTDIGAEKFGFKCPADKWSKHPNEEVELVRMGLADERPAKRGSKKAAKTTAPVVKRPVEVEEEEVDLDEALVPDIEEIGHEDEPVIQDDDDETDVDEDVSELHPLDSVEGARTDDYDTMLSDEAGLVDHRPDLGLPPEAFHTGDNEYGDDDW